MLQVPARAVAAAAIARALASLPPHQRYNISSSSEELTSIYGSATHGEVVAELEEEFYQEVSFCLFRYFGFFCLVSDCNTTVMLLF